MGKYPGRRCFIAYLCGAFDSLEFCYLPENEQMSPENWRLSFWDGLIFRWHVKFHGGTSRNLWKWFPIEGRKNDAGQFHQMLVIQNPPKVGNEKANKKPFGSRDFPPSFFFRELESGADIFVEPHGSSIGRLQIRGLIPPEKNGRSDFGSLEISGWNTRINFTWFLFCIFWAIFSGRKSLQMHPFSWQLDDENTRQTGRLLHNLTAAPVGVHPMVRGPTRAEARGGIDEQLGWKTAKNLQRAKPVILIVIMFRLLRVMFELSHPKRDMYSKACEFGYVVFHIYLLLEKQVFGVTNHGNPNLSAPKTWGQHKPSWLDYL